MASKAQKAPQTTTLDAGNPELESYGAIPPQDALSKRQVAPTVGELLSNKRVALVLGVTASLSFAWVSNETVFVLFAYTPVRLGGLQRNVCLPLPGHSIPERLILTTIVSFIPPCRLLRSDSFSL